VVLHQPVAEQGFSNGIRQRLWPTPHHGVSRAIQQPAVSDIEFQTGSDMYLFVYTSQDIHHGVDI
jgi:hypothetical protein